MYGIIILLPHPFRQRKGGAEMSILISFLVTVLANVVSYYICKWADSNDRGNK